MGEIRRTDEFILDFIRDCGRGGHIATPEDIAAIQGTFAHACLEIADKATDIARTATGRKPIPRIFAKEENEQDIQT